MRSKRLQSDEAQKSHSEAAVKWIMILTVVSGDLTTEMKVEHEDKAACLEAGRSIDTRPADDVEMTWKCVDPVTTNAE